ncbi:MAG: hypothetical protein EOO88_12850 [Pedobacter sp.]|nr:MAG: hypothetical protein EOO88_12850 [Pedobacter sp.]
MEKIKIDLIIERGDNDLSGRVTYNENLIINNGKTVDEIELKMKELLRDFEQLDPDQVNFEISYDVYALFKQFDFLNIGKVAVRAGINPGLLRQYASQVKYPSAVQAKKIEDTLHTLAERLSRVLVCA